MLTYNYHSMAGKNYYDILNVSKDATEVQIESNYFSLLAKAKTQLGEDSVEYKNRKSVLDHIYQTLRDPEKRARYNRQQINHQIAAKQPREGIIFSSIREVLFSKTVIVTLIILSAVIVILENNLNRKPNAQNITGGVKLVGVKQTTSVNTAPPADNKEKVKTTVTVKAH